LLVPVVLAGYLMIIIDTSVVVTALPSIQQTLSLSSAALSWTQNAYTIAFGGLLLLGARAGDLLGRRRVYVAGLGLFTTASLAAGLAQSGGWLFGARAVQGLAAAFAAPSTLSLLMASFPPGPERARVVRLYGALAGAGGSLGLVLGGLVTDVLSWRWGLLINVPIGVVLIALIPRHVPETPRVQGRFDLPGAVTITAGATAVVAGLVRTAQDGWSDLPALVLLAGGIALVVAFFAIESRAAQPIVPLRVLSDRRRGGAYLARMGLIAGNLSMFFFLSQELQLLHGLNPLQTGAAFLAATIPQFAMIQLLPKISAHVGERAAMLGGLATLACGLAWLSRADATTSYLGGVAPALVLCGCGMGLAFMTLTTAGIAGVAEADAGAASGLINAAQQLGAAIGLSVLVTASAGASTQADRLSGALLGCAGFAVLGLLTAAIMIRSSPRDEPEEAPSAARGAARPGPTGGRPEPRPERPAGVGRSRR
jgi:EmrB/QacA subfamily drug resistance transporter